ncbi:MAG: CotH kinase family protein [Acidobacteriota bacterium]|nr:CotH kinase family protein [Acidobacteriota bacterium]
MSLIRRCLVAVLVVAGATGRAAAQTSDDLFNPDVLQRVELWMNSADWEKLKAAFKENTYYPADVTWNGQTIRNVGIRSRGLGSRSGTKPGLRVDFDRYATSQTFLGLKSFVLDNLVQDKSGVRETVAMRFFSRMGIPAPRETHTRLYVNGAYAGLYALVESVDKTMMGRIFGSIGDDVQNDGYLFDYNYVIGSPWRFEYEGPALEPYQARFDIKTNESKSDATIWGPIEELVRLVNTTATASFEASVGEKLDLAAFVRYIAMQNFIAQNDGFNGYDGMNNFYFYRLEDRDTHVFIAWDEDNAFLTPDFQIATRLGDNVLTRNTLQVPSFSRQYYETLLEAAEAANDWMHAEMERQLTMISAAMQEDTKKPYTNADHAADGETMLAFTPARVSYVRCEVARAVGTPLPAGCAAAAARVGPQ